MVRGLGLPESHAAVAATPAANRVARIRWAVAMSTPRSKTRTNLGARDLARLPGAAAEFRDRAAISESRAAGDRRGAGRGSPARYTRAVHIGRYWRTVDDGK